MKLKNNSLIITGGILIIALAVFIIFYKFSQPQSAEKTFYTREDFPDALKVMDEEFLQDKLSRLNAFYQDLGREDYDDYAIWLNIGLLKKTMQDFRGAEVAWQKSVSLRQEPIVATANLADLYLYYLKDYQRAEEYYLRAITLNVADYNLYEGLANLYRYIMSEKIDQVEATINQGVNYSPSSAFNGYLYLIDFFDKEGNNFQKKQEYIAKTKALNPPQDVLDFILDYE